MVFVEMVVFLVFESCFSVLASALPTNNSTFWSVVTSMVMVEEKKGEQELYRLISSGYRLHGPKTVKRQEESSPLPGITVTFSQICS